MPQMNQDSWPNATEKSSQQFACTELQSNGAYMDLPSSLNSEAWALDAIYFDESATKPEGPE
jgi:hypothetical protein